MNIERLLINRISELIRNIGNTWLEENPFPIPIAPFSLLNKKDTLNPSGHKCLFCFYGFKINKKQKHQKWGVYVRLYDWKTILWRLQ
jgi:hypothetical protein